MLHLCCSCLCCPFSVLELVILFQLGAHTLASLLQVLAPGLSSKSRGTFAKQCLRDQGKVCLGLYHCFVHPPHLICVLPTKLLKLVSHEWIGSKKLLSGCSHKDGHLYSICVVFCERKRKIYVPCKLELNLEKDI